jgi:hypothetical protein
MVSGAAPGKAGKGSLKGELAGLRERPLELAAIGLEAELELIVDGRKTKPERLFGDPMGFIRQPLVHREGTSYHLPTGGAVYFDTGVIEVATPVIEIDRGCAARAGRSLWEGIRFLRAELDAPTSPLAPRSLFWPRKRCSLRDGLPAESHFGREWHQRSASCWLRHSFSSAC